MKVMHPIEFDRALDAKKVVGWLGPRPISGPYDHYCVIESSSDKILAEGRSIESLEVKLAVKGLRLVCVCLDDDPWNKPWDCYYAVEM